MTQVADRSAQEDVFEYIFYVIMHNYNFLLCSVCRFVYMEMYDKFSEHNCAFIELSQSYQECANVTDYYFLSVDASEENVNILLESRNSNRILQSLC
jgi:hypothetical protein